MLDQTKNAHKQRIFLELLSDEKVRRVIPALANFESFTDAASSLNMSKSAVSKLVSFMEGRLGWKVFARTTRQVSLTKNGEKLLVAINEFNCKLDEVVQDFAGRPFKEDSVVEWLGRFTSDYSQVSTRRSIAKKLQKLCSDEQLNQPSVAFLTKFLVQEGYLTDSDVLDALKELIPNSAKTLQNSDDWETIVEGQNEVVVAGKVWNDQIRNGYISKLILLLFR